MAKYDPTTDEFVVNSPTLTSAKFWPGELGRLATHAVVHAKLYLGNDFYGIQTFFMQIRDMDTHIPMAGIEIGDIGPKYGYGAKDNGFMRFNNYRIPRTNMLSKYTSVDEKGNF